MTATGAQGGAAEFRRGWVTAGVALVAALVYARAPLNRLAFDDVAIEAHPAIQSVRALPRVFSSAWWYEANHLYRPLTLLSLGAERLVSGGAPWLSHGISVLLHTLVAVLVMRLAMRMLPPFGALACALAFALLPVHAEAVSSIVGRAELLAALWLVLLMLLVTSDRAPTPKLRALAALLAAAALASKEVGAAAPALAFGAALVIPTQRRHASVWALSSLGGTIALLLARVVVLGEIAGDLPHPLFRGMHASTRVVVAISMLPRTALMLFLPVTPSVEEVPSLSAVQHPLWGLVSVGALLLVVMVALAVRHLRRPSPLTLGALIVVVTLSPTSNLLFAAGALTARTLYAPSIGTAMMTGALVAAIASTRWRASVRVAVGALAACGAWFTWREVPVWRDTPSMLATMVARHPDDYRGHELMAYSAREAGDSAGALRHFRDAIARFPADPEMLTDGAALALARGDTATSERWLAAAVRANPRAARARTRLYGILRARGRDEEARQLLVDGLRLEPRQTSWSEMLRSTSHESVSLPVRSAP